MRRSAISFIARSSATSFSTLSLNLRRDWPTGDSGDDPSRTISRARRTEVRAARHASACFPGSRAPFAASVFAFSELRRIEKPPLDHAPDPMHHARAGPDAGPFGRRLERGRHFKQKLLSPALVDRPRAAHAADRLSNPLVPLARKG